MTPSSAGWRWSWATPGWRMTHDSRRTPTVSPTGNSWSRLLEVSLGEDTVDAWTERLTAVGVPAGKVGSIADGFELAERLGLQPTVDLEDGRAPQVRNPITFSDTPISGYAAPPRLGATQRRRPPLADQGDHPMSTTTRSLPPFEPLDPAGIDDLLTDDEKAVRASVRQLCDERVDPHVAEWFERGQIDDLRGLAKELGSLGAARACTSRATAARG